MTLPATLHNRKALTRFDRRRLELFTKTVGKELVGSEIDHAIELAEVYGANPLVGDIHYFVFGKHGEEGRRVVPVLSIGMYRKIAARTGNYRPDDTAPRILYDEAKKSPANPKGIVSAEVSVFMHSHGEWHRVVGHVKWEERAPILVEGAFKWEDTGEVWPDTGKPKRKKVAIGDGKAVLDPGKKNWHTMPETMLAKCAEVDGIRKAWPEETSGSYGAEEMDGVVIEMTATEILEQAQASRKIDMIGGRDGIYVDFLDGKSIQRIQTNTFFDQTLRWAGEKTRTSKQLSEFMARNALARGEMKARFGHDYLEWMAEIETISKLIAEREAMQETVEN